MLQYDTAAQRHILTRGSLKCVDGGARDIPNPSRFVYDGTMLVIHDQAVVLMRYDYSETSQVLVLFSRDHGKMRVLATGIKRSTKARFATGADLLEAGHLVGSDLPARRGRPAPPASTRPSASRCGGRGS